MKRLEGMIEQAEKFNPLQNLGKKKAPPFKKDESVGGRLYGILAELRDEIKHAGYGSQDISDSDIKGLLQEVDTLESKMKKALKGKGLIGW